MPKRRKPPGLPARPRMTKAEQIRYASERFWSLVNRNGPFPPSHTGIKTRCWEWRGPLSQEGHGRFRFNNVSYYARRFSWLIRHTDPVGVLVTDRCGNKNCVRHLITRLPSENLAEASLARPYGEKHANAKLTEEKVRQIRAASATVALGVELARKFKVSRSTIASIVTQRSWKHILPEEG